MLVLFEGLENRSISKINHSFFTLRSSFPLFISVVIQVLKLLRSLFSSGEAMSFCTTIFHAPLLDRRLGHRGQVPNETKRLLTIMYYYRVD